MNKQDVVNAIATATGLTKVDSAKALDALLDTITSALKKGDKVTLTGFGTFEPRKTKARVGRNPQTGEEIQIKAARVANFKVGKNLKEAVQKS